jgi:O-antigen ligase
MKTALLVAVLIYPKGMLLLAGILVGVVVAGVIGVVLIALLSPKVLNEALNSLDHSIENDS